MGLAPAQLAVDGERGAVGADHHLGMHEGAAEVGLVELEEDHVALAPLVHEEIHGGVERIDAPARGRDVVEPATPRPPGARATTRS